MKTVLIIYVLVNYICAYLMTLTVRVSRRHFTGVEFFLANFILQSVGMSLAIMRPHIAPFLSIFIANICMYVGIIAIAFGAARFTERRIIFPPYILLLLAFIALYWHFTFVLSDVRIRTMCFTGLALPVFLRIAHLFLTPEQPENRKHCLHAGITFVLFFCLYLFRFAYAYRGNSFDNYFAAPAPDTIANTLTLLLTILLMYSIQYMINSRLVAETEHHAVTQAAMLKEMETLATRDHLTGIYNRRKMEEIIHTEVAKCDTYGTQLSLILCDIDSFKSINDTYGHDVGDQTIVHVIQCISEHMRQEDHVARWGGEEFIIIAPGATVVQAERMAERFRAAIESRQPHMPIPGTPVTVSFGVAQYRAWHSVAGFLKSADNALYRAKQNGKNQVATAPHA